MSAGAPEEAFEVVIQASERVKHCIIVRMSAAEFEEMRKMLASDDLKEREEVAEKVHRMVDTMQTFDANGFEVEELSRFERMEAIRKLMA